jgi:hypothetical protein
VRSDLEKERSPAAASRGCLGYILIRTAGGFVGGTERSGAERSKLPDTGTAAAAASTQAVCRAVVVRGLYSSAAAATNSCCRGPEQEAGVPGCLCLGGDSRTRMTFVG